MVSARGALRSEGFKYSMDNGAWTAHQAGTPFDFTAFWAALAKMGAGSDFVVVPDKVGDARETVEMSRASLARVLDVAPVALLAVQDGMTPADLVAPLGPRVGVFVGGTTEWKLENMALWCLLAKRAGAWGHVGRVNSCKRIHACNRAGAASFDGSGPSRFAVVLPKLDSARRQGELFFEDLSPCFDLGVHR